MIIKYLDIPQFFLGNTISFKFFLAIKNHSLQIFGHKSVQILINERVRQLKIYYYILQTIPFMVNFVAWLLWTNYSVHNLHEPENVWAKASDYLRNLLVVCCIYDLMFNVFKFIAYPR
jgi:hypothetical protein